MTEEAIIREDEDLLLRVATALIETVRENRHLREENKALEEQHKRDRENLEAAWKGSQDIASSWMKALLDGDLQLAKKN